LQVVRQPYLRYFEYQPETRDAMFRYRFEAKIRLLAKLSRRTEEP
jgi:hypothetical protein